MRRDPSLAYLEFKAAQALYRKPIPDLAPEDLQEVRRVAQRQQWIQLRVLAAPEASGVCVPEATLASTVGEIRQRYTQEEEFEADLRANGLDRTELEAALRRELAVEAVLERVSSQAPPVSDTDAELYYRLHMDQFMQPERRRASHILITINEQFPENRRDAARARIEAIAARLQRDGGRFAEQAMKHSECPSALQGGVLGEYHTGQLFPALDAVLLALPAGQLSEVVESPLGFHILRCDAILPPELIPFPEAVLQIRTMLADNRSRTAQRAWLRQLLRSGSVPEEGVAAASAQM